MSLNLQSYGTGQDVVFIHGWGLHSAVWHDVAQSVSSYARAILIDLPGFGRSPFHGEFSLDSIQRQLTERVEPGAIWVGWSLGGLLTLSLAINKPEWVSKLVCVSCSPCFGYRDNWPYGMKKEVMEGFSTQLKQDYKTTISRFLSLQTKGSVEGVRVLKRLRQISASAQTPDPRVLEAGLELLKNTDLRSALTDIQCPALWVLGGRDRIVNASYLQEWPLNDLLTGKNKLQAEIIKEASHVPFLSHPQQFQTLLKEFILSSQE